MKYGYFKDKEGKDIYIDDKHILHNGKKLVDVINSKANSNEVLDNLNKYADGETIIGTYYGKPLYRQVFNFKVPQCTTSGTSVLETHTLSLNQDYIYVERAMIRSDLITGNLPYITRQNPNQNIGYDLGDGTNIRLWNSFPDWNFITIDFWVCYTKTTD